MLFSAYMSYYVANFTIAAKLPNGFTEFVGSLRSIITGRIIGLGTDRFQHTQ
jgi:hypothetical protein